MYFNLTRITKCDVCCVVTETSLSRAARFQEALFHGGSDGVDQED